MSFDRRKFLKLTGTLGLTTPVLFNSTQAWASAAPLVNCDNLNDRVVVIVRLAGANDGLNTIIPLNQYSEYSFLRPDIKLNNTGTNSIISLDANHGIHPSMSAFATLLGQNKLAVFNGVGYPTANYSHFTSENTMFAGKDGTSNANLQDGMMGRYLENIFPGMAGSPNRLMLDPVALHFGNSNPCLIFGHTHNNNIEYNATSLQSTLFGLLAPSIYLPDNSDYGVLQEYLRGVEKSMDSYYNRILSVFNAGYNSSTTYPNTSLGKQLRSVARLIKGGSKTKIFMVTIGGFDTHIDQIQTGSTHLGDHANLLGNVANSISAFQTDIEALGIGQKILTVSFSEFGRQVKQNASLGTDHGDISPFFVIGQNVNGGIYGTHPSLSVPAAATGSASFYYPTAQRKYDYRQIYSTILQDWLGADASVMSASQMDSTSIGITASAKIPNLISSSQNASPNCLTNQLIDCHRFPYDDIDCVKIFEANGWSYYGITGTSDNSYYFGIEHKPTATGGNTNDFTAKIKIRKSLCSPTGNKAFFRKDGTDATYVMGVTWTIQFNTGSQNGFVNIRFFQSNTLLVDTIQEAAAYKTLVGATYISPELWFKTLTPLSLPNDLRAQGLFMPMYPLGSINSGSINGVVFKEWSNQSNIDGNSGGCMIKVTSFNEGNFVKKPATPPYMNGTMRFNQVNNHFEGFDGFEWVILDK